MAVQLRNFNPTPLVAEVINMAANAWRTVPRESFGLVLDDSLMWVESAAFSSLATSAVRNTISEALSNLKIESSENCLTRRLRYVETSLISLVSTVYNLAISIIFSALSLVTLGSVKSINTQCKKHWLHTGIALGSFLSANIGIVSPRLGALSAVLVLTGLVFGGAMSAQKHLATACSRIYQENKDRLRNAVFAGPQGDEESNQRFRLQVTPCLNHIDANFREENVNSISDIVNVFKRASNVLPPNLFANCQVRVVV